MRKLFAAVMVAGAALVGGQAIAADFPYYPPVIEIPDVDYGVSGSFYLRGSAAGNLLWAPHVEHPTVTSGSGIFAINQFGYGYSVGAGAGYEFGNGFRTDATVDYVSNENMQATFPAGTTFPQAGPPPAGDHKLSLRSTIVLANAYYDFALTGDGYGASGGAFGYVGAGAGVAFNDFVSSGPGNPDTRDQNTSFAGAGMVGVGYDFGAVVADVGYRAVYINRIQNDAALNPYTIDNSWLHEVRGTLRYRFN